MIIDPPKYPLLNESSMTEEEIQKSIRVTKNELERLKATPVEKRADTLLLMREEKARKRRNKSKERRLRKIANKSKVRNR